ncbi:MAG TPA: AAA family ATPase [Acidobacteriaceae bacterium]|jgi:predicted ATPase|nr:AAA family ATPase [Acidobacteriaceae bacterium]
MLKRLALQNFKSIASASVDFSNFTFLVGRNGSGKSNVADALAFAAEAAEWPLQTVFNRRGGPLSVARRRPIPSNRGPAGIVEFGIGLEFGDFDLSSGRYWPSTPTSARYAFLLSIGRFGFEVLREQCIVAKSDGSKSWFDRARTKFRSSVDFLNGSSFSFLSRDALAIPFVGSIVDFMPVSTAMKSMAVYSIDPTKLREFQDPDEGKRLSTDGSNAASVLESIKSDPAKFQRLFQILSTVVPDLEQVRPQTIGRKQQLRFAQRWAPNERIYFDAFNMSDGTVRAFGILLALFQLSRPDLLVIEEPETSLHPAATAAIVETLRAESKRSQIIITTHSPEVLDMANASEDNFKIAVWNRGQTRIGDVVGAAKAALQGHLASPGELMKMLILDAPPLFEEFEEDKQQVLFEDLGAHTADS